MAGKKVAVTRRRRATADDLWKGHDPPPSTAPVDHVRAFDETRSWSARFYRWLKSAEMKIEPRELIDLLNRAGVRFILMGHYGISGWLSETRSTYDVDVLVQKRHHAKAVQAIQAAYPTLTRVDLPVVTRFLDPDTGQPVIDVMKPKDVYAQAFKHTVRVGASHEVPNLELALAAKFAALISRNREAEKKHLDASDFIALVKRNHAAIKQSTLRQLADAVYHGGGEEILKLVADAKAGRPLRV